MPEHHSLIVTGHDSMATRLHLLGGCSRSGTSSRRFQSHQVIPPSTEGWYSAKAWSPCRVHPVQIVASDTRDSTDRVAGFTCGLARTLNQQWIYAVRMPVCVADRRGEWK